MRTKHFKQEIQQDWKKSIMQMHEQNSTFCLSQDTCFLIFGTLPNKFQVKSRISPNESQNTLSKPNLVIWFDNPYYLYNTTAINSSIHFKSPCTTEKWVTLRGKIPV